MVDTDDIIDFAQEFAIEAATEGAVKTAFRGARNYLNRNTNAVRDADRAYERDRKVRVMHGLCGRVAALEADAGNKTEFLAKVEEMVNDHQFWRMHDNLGYEAARSVLDDRREMLEAAAIGLCDPNVSIEDKARVERTLRSLDPEDVELLDQLRRFHEWKPSTRLEEIQNSNEARMDGAAEILDKAPISKVALLTTGCVDADRKWGGEMYIVSALGKLMLQALSTYSRVAWDKG